MAKAWRVLIAVCIIYFITAGTVLYGMSVVMKPLTADMDWTRAQGTSGITVLMLATGLLGPLVSALIDRFNIRNTVLIGAACVALGAASAYATAGLVQYYLSLALLGFGMSAMTFIPMSQMVARWFVKRRGLAMRLLFQAAGFVILLFADRDVLVYGFALVFGIGLRIVTAPLMLANYFSTSSLARINATTGIFTIGVTAFAPTIAGYASDTFGS